jgi:hypothetical protein
MMQSDKGHFTCIILFSFIFYTWRTFSGAPLVRVYLPVLVTAAGDESIVFPDKAADKHGTYGTSPPQPKGISSNHGDTKAKDGAKPRFGYDTGGMSTNFNFGVQPNGGGISGSASFSSSYGGQGQGHTASQSHSFNFQTGSNSFSASQAASQSSSFNSQFPGYHGYERGISNKHNDQYIYTFLYHFTLFILCIQKFLIGYFPTLFRNANTQTSLHKCYYTKQTVTSN